VPDVVVGRETQHDEIEHILRELKGSAGAALVFRGPAGIGKTSLLRSAEALARQEGAITLSVSAVQSETNIPYAGLGQLLTPLLRKTVADVEPARAMIRSAVDGSAEPAQLPPHRIALAALELLSAEASAQPVCLLVDDIQWLDQQSWEALSFAARRIAADPVAVFMAARDGQDTTGRLASSHLPESPLEPLTGDQAEALLAYRAPSLPDELRRRVIAEAAGNPLGLLELAASASRLDVSAGVPDSLPLTERIERTYAAVVGELPALTRSLLLVAAFDDRDEVPELLAAASHLAGQRVGLEEYQPGVDAGLVTTNGFALQFRHPLIRSALQQTAPAAERLAAHTAIAAALTPSSDRQVWHRALGLAEPNEDVATRLAELGIRARHQGALRSAMEAFERSAHLSEDSEARVGRLIWAAGTASELGDVASVQRLATQIDTAELRGVHRARYLWLRELLTGEGWSGDAQFDRIAAVVRQLIDMGDHELALDSLETAALRFWWVPPSDDIRATVLDLVDLIDGGRIDPRRIRVSALTAPVARTESVLADLAFHSRRPPSDAMSLLALGETASGVGDYGSATRFLQAAVDRMRASGQMGLLTAALMSQAWVAAHRGEARLALAAAGEAYDLATEQARPQFSISAHLTMGIAEALRGNVSTALAIAAEEEERLHGGGRHPFLCLVQMIRGVAMLADGRPVDAFDHLARVFESDDPAFHPHAQLTIVGHLVEAGTLAGADVRLDAILARCRVIASGAPWPVLVMALRYASAVHASDDEQPFVAALQHDLSEWPFERARLQLAYGAWLRRHRRHVESRPVLREAQQSFQALGTTPWAERARHELRASGEAVRRRSDRTGDLTPQELKIAQLAASGLSNVEIARQLFLSPRTVTTHLYRIYPKVGVRSRSGLSNALQGR
jgi:DNA-binding CsgD family transcriptional regulator